METGETFRHTAVRELHEETGMQAEADDVVTAVDAFDYDKEGDLLHHFVLVPVRCIWEAGDPVAGDDALEARWFSLEEVTSGHIDLSADVASVAIIASQIDKGRDDPAD